MGITGAAEAVMGKSRSDNQLIAGLEDINRSRDLLAIKDFDDNEWGEFIVCLNNMRNYGASSWYDWAIKNWGTKWNAYYQSIQRLEGKDIIQFDTAWSDVHGLIAKVAPENLTINYEYADEDTGSNTGVYDYIQGEEIGGPFENGSKQAYNLAFKLNPSSSEYYKLIDGKYEYVEDDE